MSQLWVDDKVVPVTIIEAGPCVVTQLKNIEKDGCCAMQIGFVKLKDNKIKKSQRKKPFKHLREARLNNAQEIKAKEGEIIDVSVFTPGEAVKISAISKGKGFQGAVKRWGFHGSDATHGTKHAHRSVGSIGSSFPERVFRGKKMPGREGARRVTVRNLKVVEVDKEKNLIKVRGAVPGRRGTILEIRG